MTTRKPEPKRPPGRPRLTQERLERYTISLSRADYEYLQIRGDGGASAGARLIIAEARKRRPPSK